MFTHFCPRCGIPLTPETVSWRIRFPANVIDAPTAPFLLDALNERFGGVEVRSAGQTLLSPAEWTQLLSEMQAHGSETDFQYYAPDSSTGVLRTFLRGHTPVRLDAHACCPHCGVPRDDAPGHDLPAGFFDFERVIGVAIAGSISWGKTCLLLSMLFDNCRALNRVSALNPLVEGGDKPRFSFSAPRLSDRIRTLLQTLEYPPYECPLGTQTLDEPIAVDLTDRRTDKRYLVLLYDTAGEFYRSNQEAQLRFLEYAAGLIYLIDPKQTSLQCVSQAAQPRPLRPLSLAEQAACQTASPEPVPPAVWRSHPAAAPAEPAGSMLRNLLGLSGGMQNLLPDAVHQHIAYVLVKADKLYHSTQGPFLQLCGAETLMPALYSTDAGAYYMRCEVNEMLFDRHIDNLHRSYQAYLPHYSLHTVSALGNDPVIAPDSNVYRLRSAPTPHLVEEPLLAIIRSCLE